jgi:hypothetical protein
MRSLLPELSGALGVPTLHQLGFSIAVNQLKDAETLAAESVGRRR